MVWLPLSVMAQEGLVNITNSMFSPRHRLVLSEKDGWFAREGFDKSWIKKDLSLPDWKKMPPSAIAGGGHEGKKEVEWTFRIRIRIDSSCHYQISGFISRCWASSEVYLNDSLVAEFGHTGSLDSPYQENRFFSGKTIPLYLTKGVPYNFAVHVVDKVPSWGQGYLRSAFGLGDLLIFTTTSSVPIVLLNAAYLERDAVLLAIAGLIALLFWCFWLLQPADKNQLIFALCATCLAVMGTLQVLVWTTDDLSFNGMQVNRLFFFLTLSVALGLIFPILANILKVSARSWIRYSVYILLGFLFLAAQLPKLNKIAGILTIIYVLICLGMVAKWWQRIHGAAWAVVTGLLTGILLFMVSFAADALQVPLPIWLDNLVYVASVGSIPIGLVLYAAIRFREINLETKSQAARLVQLSEEKRQQAEHQQEILEQEVKKQTADLRNTLTELRKTQAQLIQSEKMASLGELTAGIAHEIQNPLNFVNNFSEVNAELIRDMKDELQKGNMREVNSIADHILGNEEKINHHGKRADAIVKSMLLHSRSSAGVQELTDINALADESMRLAYHGIRAKHKDLTVELVTAFDQSVKPMNMVRQDMGRVFLNLFNNAFFSVFEKHALNNNYQPRVSITTRRSENDLEILVADNGIGIPEKNRDKIFQPFFTSKPAGEGTGLGLSLSYDIIKAHGGTLSLGADNSEGAIFRIILPLL